MQIKTTDGTLVQIAPMQVERAMHLLGKQVKSSDAKSQDDLDQFIVVMHQQACAYKEKAQNNIKRIADLQDLPQTQDDMKHALDRVLRHGTSLETADIIYELAEFQSSKFLSHLLQNAIDQEK